MDFMRFQFLNNASIKLFVYSGDQIKYKFGFHDVILVRHLTIVKLFLLRNLEPVFYVMINLFLLADLQRRYPPYGQRICIATYAEYSPSKLDKPF